MFKPSFRNYYEVWENSELCERSPKNVEFIVDRVGILVVYLDVAN